MNFTQIMETCNKIKSISSINEKKEFLASITDEDFKNFLRWEFDSSIVSGLSDKKINKVLADNMFDDGDWSTCDAKTIFDVFRYLENHKTGTDNDIKTVQWYRKQICKNDEEVEFFNNVIIKNVILGCDKKVINSVWNGLIPNWEVALCSKFSDYSDYFSGTKEYEVTLKIDGGRCTAVKLNNKTVLISRQGKVWEGLHEVENAINNLSEDALVFDGELTIQDFMNYPSDEVYKRTMKIISSKDENKVGIQFNVFDVLTYDEWCNGCKTVQKDRRTHLNKLMSENKSKALYCLPILYVGKDPSKIGELMKTLVEPNNQEGIVLKDTNAIYEHKRCKSWLKVKAMETYDLRIVDTFEGENSLVGKLGGFVAEITLPDGKFVHTKIGSGFSLEDRERLWPKRSELIGKAIEVQGFELTTNDKSDFYSIRFPVFKDFIEEGKELNGDYKGI